MPKKELTDTIEKILFSKGIIDSSTITVHSYYDLVSLKKKNAKIYTSGFCFYIDSIYLDTLRITKVMRYLEYDEFYPLTNLKNQPIIKQIGNETFNLKNPLLLSWDFFYLDFYEGTCFTDSTNMLSNCFYRKSEIDDHSNFSFQKMVTDENQNVWIKVKFNCDFCVTTDQKEIEGWTLLFFLEIGYYGGTPF